MNSLKLIKEGIRLKNLPLSSLNSAYSSRFFNSYRNHRFIQPQSHFISYNPLKKVQRRLFTTSSFENVEESKPSFFNSSTSEGDQKPEYSMDKDQFLKILKLSGDGSNDLMNLIQKCRDDLHTLSSTSYPFKKYDLRVLMELLSSVLSLRSNRDIDLLCNLLDSHKMHKKLTFALDFCKIFSSSYESISKRPSPFITKLANKGMMILAKYFIPNFSECLNEKHLKGVKFAFNSLSESINNQNMGTLEQCCNTSLFNFIKNGIEFLNSMKMKIKFEIRSIDELIMDKFYLTIGGIRTDAVRDIFSKRGMTVNPVVVPSGKIDPPKSTEEYRELILKSFEKGAIVRMEVIVFSNQNLSLLDENEETLWTDLKPFSTHRLCFETEFKPNPDSREGEKTKFQVGDWVLVDINGVLNNNNPF